MPKRDSTCSSEFARYWRAHSWARKGRLRLVAIGTFCFGAVIGWASAFVGWSWTGLAFRVLAFGAVAVSLVVLGLDRVLLGIAGAALGVTAHEAMLGAIRGRA